MRWIAALVACLALAGCWRDPVAGKVSRGNQHYAAGRFAEALAAYRDAQIDAPDDPRISFDIGNALYRQGTYPEAEQAYARALAAGDTVVRAMAAYNTGNSRFRQGNLSGAAESYEQALVLDPGDREAKFNLELVQKLLERAAQQSGQGGNPPRASDWARRRAEEAEGLARQDRYAEADEIMRRTLAAEPAARAEFGTFAERLHDLVTIFGGGP